MRSMSMQPSIDAASLLREHGVQVMAQRLAVLRAVSGRPHGTADDVAEVVRSEIGAISRQAVYDALGMLADKGLDPAHPARRFTGPFRGPGRRQPSPLDLPHLRRDGRRRLRSR